jgi:hypothetical protein
MDISGVFLAIVLVAVVLMSWFQPKPTVNFTETTVPLTSERASTAMAIADRMIAIKDWPEALAALEFIIRSRSEIIEPKEVARLREQAAIKRDQILGALTLERSMRGVMGSQKGIK